MDEHLPRIIEHTSIVNKTDSLECMDYHRNQRNQRMS